MFARLSPLNPEDRSVFTISDASREDNKFLGIEEGGKTIFESVLFCKLLDFLPKEDELKGFGLELSLCSNLKLDDKD